MKAVILYDSRTSNGSTEAIIDSIGLSLAESGFYVEKAKCKAAADYSFVKDFDLVILGAPVYYFVVASQLLGSLIQGNLKTCLKRKKIALFLNCGSSEPVAALLYLPQLKMHLIRNKILVEKIFAPAALVDGSVDSFVEDLLFQYHKPPKSKVLSAKWTVEAQEWFQSMPAFMQGKFRTMAEEYAEQMGYQEITLAVLVEARDNLGGT
ncbi:MAG: protochlorophyllide oxidoreductase [Chlorobium sp.]|nr:MAG: protochlorophyllide oxidoreductase [Chlorobium sp.]